MNMALRNTGASQEEFRRAALQVVAFQLAMRRRFPQAPDDEQAVSMVMAWNDKARRISEKAINTAALGIAGRWPGSDGRSGWLWAQDGVTVSRT
jgi:hypothetical protein